MKKLTLVRCLFLSPILLAGACATAHFEPTSDSRRITADKSAAFYDIDIDGKKLGDAKVWSPGARAGDASAQAEGAQNVVQVNVRLRNDASGPASFDVQHTDLELTTGDSSVRVVNEPLAVSGDLTVPPGDISHITLVYALPDGLSPRGVDGFDLNWAVDAPEGRYTQTTTFRRERLSDGGGYGYYYPYGYGPYYDYGPWWPRYY